MPLLNDSDFLDELTQQIRQHLAPLERAKGIQFRMGNLTFDREGSYCRIPLIAYAEDPDGHIHPIEERDLQAAQQQLPWLKEKDLTKPIFINGQGFLLKGYFPKTAKYAFLGEHRKTGQVCRLSRRAVQRACERA